MHKKSSEEMIKAGILTTYWATNYGAMLQPYGLKCTLEKMGCDVEIIRYRQKYIDDGYNPWSHKKLFGLPLRDCLHFWRRILIVLYKRQQHFRAFMKRYLGVKPGFDEHINSDKDIYLIGSDQLWRQFEEGKMDAVYLGHFPTNNHAVKVTYAVSGELVWSKFDASLTQYIRKSMANFAMISMREESIASQYRTMTGRKDIEVVLDPSLLADDGTYDRIAAPDPLPGTSYALFYAIRPGAMQFMPRILDYVRSRHWQLVLLTEGYDADLRHQPSDIHYWPTASPDIFLALVKNARCIFTPSFHGAAFSILFRKPFFSLMLRDGHDTRPSHLLDILGLKSRAIGIDEPWSEDTIDYTPVIPKLDTLRAASQDFLQRALLLTHQQRAFT